MMRPILAAAVVAGAWRLRRGRRPAEHCACGSNPPPPPAMRTVTPYAGEPEDLSPFSKFTTPYYQNYITPTSTAARPRRSRAQPRISPRFVSASSVRSRTIPIRSSASACCTACNSPSTKPMPPAATAASPSS